MPLTADQSRYINEIIEERKKMLEEEEQKKIETIENKFLECTGVTDLQKEVLFKRKKKMVEEQRAIYSTAIERLTKLEKGLSL